jgi:hypothetical protein
MRRSQRQMEKKQEKEAEMITDQDQEVPNLETSKKRSRSKKSKFSSSSSKKQKQTIDLFRKEPFQGLDHIHTYMFQVPRFTSTSHKDEHDADDEEDDDPIGYYPVILEWNPPFHAQWSCSCGTPYGIPKRHDCKHVRSILHYMNNRKEYTSEMNEHDKNMTDVMNSMKTL